MEYERYGYEGGDLMGNHPFLKYCTAYLNDVYGHYSPATYKNLDRRFRRMDRDVEKLVSDGVLTTASPAKWVVQDVVSYINYRYSLNRAQSEMCHEVGALKKVMIQADNLKTFDVAFRRFPNMRPRKRDEALPSIEQREYKLFMDGMSVVDEKDYYELRRYAVMGLSIFCGLRAKEIRLSSVKDIIRNEDHWYFDIVHVKGEKTYGKRRVVPIPKEFHDHLTKYLRAREEYIRVRCPDSKLLFPSPTSDNGELASNTLRADVKRINEQLGTSFNLRDGRRTFGQKYLDGDVSIEDVSVLMGHNSTETTEGFYCRRRNVKSVNAVKDLKGIWDPDKKMEFRI